MVENKKINVAVVGAAGYAGIEAVSLLLKHPIFNLTCATSDSDAGNYLSDLYPYLINKCDLKFDHHDVSIIASKAKVAFLAVPHTAALDLAPKLLDAGLKVLDLSADFRLKDINEYEDWYQTKHTQTDLLKKAVYGLPEIFSADLSADLDLVSCPGCYPTASALAAFPALKISVKNDWIADNTVVVSALSGVSGAGKSCNAKTHFCNCDENVGIYGLLHRHTPEISQSFSLIANKKINVCFTPHLVPISRGLLSTAYIKLKSDADYTQICQEYVELYKDKSFVSYLGDNVMPQTRNVKNTIYAHVGTCFDYYSNTLIASCAIDNLCKGAAGQAIQCANIICGLDQTCGLDNLGSAI
ncbi:MAG: N-acetyl-gamma-glutamyl-phosphate reductase [Coriobacteriales bacterium]|nr:N-acetyl-gamma-glutamyl-phosphate reductase [Coriobacteriales bacterium]